MDTLARMVDARRRNNFGYDDEPNFFVYGGGGNQHDHYSNNYYRWPAYDHAAPYPAPNSISSPIMIDHHDDHYSNSYQRPALSSAISPPYGYHHPSNKSSSPALVVDHAAVEWKDTAEAHIFKTALPAGVKKEDVKVQVEDDQILKISGEIRAAETEDRQGNWRRMELSRGKFMTALKLPGDAMVDQIKSSLENGVLTVRIPRRDVHSHPQHVRNVEISSF